MPRIASASTSAGIACMASVTRMITVSTPRPAKPATSPSGMAAARARPTEPALATIEIRVAKMRRLRTSRPRSSWPSGYVPDGPWLMARRCCFSVECGANRLGNSATSTSSTMTVRPTMPKTSWRNRCQNPNARGGTSISWGDGPSSVTGGTTVAGAVTTGAPWG